MSERAKARKKPPDELPPFAKRAVPFTPKEAQDILRLLCCGACLENKIHLSCYIFRAGGRPVDLGLRRPDPYLNPFCNCADQLESASERCREWHEAIATAIRRDGPVAIPQVRECPFGLSVLVAPVPAGDSVTAVLFTGNWREIGAEGMVYHCIKRACIPPNEAMQLKAQIHNVEGLMNNEQVETHKQKLGQVVASVSQLVAMLYVRNLALREHELIQDVHEGLAQLAELPLQEACRSAGDVLKSVRRRLSMKYIVFFANTGARDRLEAKASAGLSQKLLKGTYLAGKPVIVLQELNGFRNWTAEKKQEWLQEYMRRDDKEPVDRRLFAMGDLAPISLGASFCGMLAFGPVTESNTDKENVMDADDRRYLALVAHKYLTNGLREMVERQEVGEILGVASHILRGPLMAIQGAIDILRDQLLDGDAIEGEVVREVCGDLQNEIDDITAEAERMLEARKTNLYEWGEPVFKSASLAVLLDKVIPGMQRRVDERGNRFGTIGSIRALPNVEFDWNQMRVVFANLLDNALKYIHFGKPIEFCGEQIADRKGRPAVRVTISDFGTGIHPDEIKNDIFRAGRRGSVRDDKRDIVGTGMGLAVCKDIVEKVHDGRIWAECIESTCEAGSYQHCQVRFHIVLPIQQPKS